MKKSLMEETKNKIEASRGVKVLLLLALNLFSKP